MSSYRRLSYDSLKHIFQYFDPATRLLITNRCPSLSAVDKCVPLKISEFHHGKQYLQINSTKYIVGVIQVYKNGRTIDHLRRRNFDGGSMVDVDRYGFPVNRNELTEDEEGVRILRLERQLRNFRLSQRTRAQRRQLGAILVHDHDSRIEELEFQLMCHQSHLARTEPPFRNYLQILIVSENRRQIERLVYDKTIKEASEYLLEKIVGQRHVQISTLIIGRSHINRLQRILGGEIIVDPQERNQTPRTLFLPIEPGELELKNIILYKNEPTLLNYLRPIISKPLKSIRMLPSTDINDQLVQTAEQVFLSRATIDTVLRLPNPKVHFERASFNMDQVEEFVNTWKRTKVQMGRYFSISFYDPSGAEDLLHLFNMLQDSERGELPETRFTRFPECTIIPMKTSLELNVYCEEANEEEKKDFECNWLVKIYIRPRGFAYRLY